MAQKAFTAHAMKINLWVPHDNEINIMYIVMTYVRFIVAFTFLYYYTQILVTVWHNANHRQNR